jgi:hypothetical protein
MVSKMTAKHPLSLEDTVASALYRSDYGKDAEPWEYAIARHADREQFWWALVEEYRRAAAVAVAAVRGWDNWNPQREEFVRG